MFFLTKSECIARLGITEDGLWNRGGAPAGKAECDGITVYFEDKIRPYALADLVASWLLGFESCVFLVDEFGIWPSSENLHLYYRLRQSYGDNRHLRDAPGHEFIKREWADLATFLDVAIQFGWGGYLFAYPNDTQMRLSHDGWLQIFSTEIRKSMLADLDHRQLPYRLGAPDA